MPILYCKLFTRSEMLKILQILNVKHNFQAYLGDETHEIVIWCQAFISAFFSFCKGASLFLIKGNFTILTETVLFFFFIVLYTEN